MTFEQTTDAYMLSKNCEVAIMDSYYQFPIADILPREEAKLQDLNPGDILIMEGMTGYRSAIDNCRILEVIKPE